MKKRTVTVIAVMFFLTGVFFAWSRFGPSLTGPSEPVEVREIAVPKPETEHLAGTAGEKAVPARKPESTPGFDFRPAEGEPFSQSDLEGSRMPAQEITPRGSEPAVFDLGTIHPVVRETAEQAKEIVEDLDRKTLETTKKVLDSIPFVEIKPEKAELRPSGDGVKLTITVDPQNISFGKKSRGETASPDNVSSEDDEPAREQKQ
jgi:hypothetical protein